MEENQSNIHGLFISSDLKNLGTVKPVRRYNFNFQGSDISKIKKVKPVT